MRRLFSDDLRRVGYPRLWIGETVSTFGSQFTNFAVPLTALIILDATAFEIGLLNSADSAAVLLLGLSAGVLADRFRKRPVMIAGNLLRFAALMLVPILFWMDALSIWALVGVMFCVGLGGVLTDSAYSAYVYELVPRKSLTTANSWAQASSSTSDVAGPGLAGILFQVLGGPIILLIDALSYLFNSLLLMTLPRGSRVDLTPQGSHLAEIRSGIKELWDNRVLRTTTLAAAHSNLFHSMFFAVFLLYVVQVLDIAPATIGVIMSASGIFGILGARLATPVADRWGFGRVLSAVYFIPGAAALLVPASYGVPHWLSVVMVSAALSIWTFAVVINLIVSETLKQAFAPEGQLARITSCIRVLSWGIEPIGAISGGLLATYVLSLQTMLYISAIGLASATVWVLDPSVLKLDRLPSLRDDEPTPEPTRA